MHFLKANRKFQFLLQHYPGKAKINVNIPNTTSPELKSSSPPSLSSSSIPVSTTTERKRSPTAPISNGDSNAITTDHKKKVLISIRVNRSKCSNLGPYLDPKKVTEHIPDQFGLGPIHQVVRKSVQRLVDVSLDQKAVFGMLRQGEGRVIITASFEDKIQSVRLPAMENEASVIDFLEILFEELRCEPFYEVFKKDLSHEKNDPEDKPLKNGSLKRKGSNDNVTLTFSNSLLPATSSATSTEAFPPTLTAAVDPGPSTTPKIPRLSSIDPASFYNGSNNKNHKSTGQKPRGRPLGSKNVLPPKSKPKSSPKHAPTPPSPGGGGSSGLLASPTKNKSGPIYQNAHKLHLAQEKAKALAAAAATMTSRTLAPTTLTAATPEPTAPMPKLEPEQLPKDPTLWTIDNVISHLSHLDSALRPHVEMFRSHEIDGNALLLLTSDMMMKYMGMKLGPALKICNIINMIQGKKHQQIPK